MSISLLDPKEINKSRSASTGVRARTITLVQAKNGVEGHSHYTGEKYDLLRKWGVLRRGSTGGDGRNKTRVVAKARAIMDKWAEHDVKVVSNLRDIFGAVRQFRGLYCARDIEIYLKVADGYMFLDSYGRRACGFASDFSVYCNSKSMYFLIKAIFEITGDDDMDKVLLQHCSGPGEPEEVYIHKILALDYIRQSRPDLSAALTSLIKVEDVFKPVATTWNWELDLIPLERMESDLIALEFEKASKGMDDKQLADLSDARTRNRINTLENYLDKREAKIKAQKAKESVVPMDRRDYDFIADRDADLEEIRMTRERIAKFKTSLRLLSPEVKQEISEALARDVEADRERKVKEKEAVEKKKNGPKLTKITKVIGGVNSVHIRRNR